MSNPIADEGEPATLEHLVRCLTNSRLALVRITIGHRVPGSPKTDYYILFFFVASRVYQVRPLCCALAVSLRDVDRQTLGRLVASAALIVSYTFSRCVPVR